MNVTKNGSNDKKTIGMCSTGSTPKLLVPIIPRKPSTVRILTPSTKPQVISKNASHTYIAKPKAKVSSGAVRTEKKVARSNTGGSNRLNSLRRMVGNPVGSVPSISQQYRSNATTPQPQKNGIGQKGQKPVKPQNVPISAKQPLKRPIIPVNPRQNSPLKGARQTPLNKKTPKAPAPRSALQQRFGSTPYNPPVPRAPEPAMRGKGKAPPPRGLSTLHPTPPIKRVKYAPRPPRAPGMMRRPLNRRQGMAFHQQDLQMSTLYSDDDDFVVDEEEEDNWKNEMKGVLNGYDKTAYVDDDDEAIVSSLIQISKEEERALAHSCREEAIALRELQSQEEEEEESFEESGANLEGFIED